MPAPSPIVGLGTLDALKAAVLPPSLMADADFDAPLTIIGKGVAARFDSFTARKLARQVDAQWEGTADRVFVSLPGYPVEAVTKAELRYSGQTDDNTLNGVPVWSDYTPYLVGTLDALCGVLDLQVIQGSVFDRLRITYTGGYWIDGTPTADGTAVAAMPDTATPLPDDLFSAWTLQCAAELQARDVLGVGVTRDEKASTVDQAAGRLIPSVLDVLRSYRRMAIA